MRRPRVSAVAVLVALVAACSSTDQGVGPPASLSSGDAEPGGVGDGASDATAADGGAAPADGGASGDSAVEQDTGDDADAGNGCAVSGAPGECLTVAECEALGNHTSFSGHCPGPADIECCIVTPNTANNPPVPAGYVLMKQSQVTSAMTTWAVMILDDPTTYPMFSITLKTFGTLTVLARVEWHPPDFNNGAVHRGVTLYEPG